MDSVLVTRMRVTFEDDTAGDTVGNWIKENKVIANALFELETRGKGVTGYKEGYERCFSLFCRNLGLPEEFKIETVREPANEPQNAN